MMVTKMMTWADSSMPLSMMLMTLLKRWRDRHRYEHIAPLGHGNVDNYDFDARTNIVHINFKLSEALCAPVRLKDTSCFHQSFN